MQRYLFVWVINHWQNFPDQSIQDFFTFSRISKHWHIQREIVVNCKLSPLTVDPFPTSQLAMPLERESPELCTCHMSKCALNFYHTFLAHFNLCLFQYVIVCTLREKMTPFSVSSLLPFLSACSFCCRQEVGKARPSPYETPPPSQQTGLSRFLFLSNPSPIIGNLCH